MEKSVPFFIPTSAFLLALGAACWLMGWDYTIAQYVANNDTQHINTLWRRISLLGLGKVQMLFCLTLLYVAFKRGNIPVTGFFWPQTLRAVVTTFGRFFIGRFSTPSLIKNWQKPYQALFLAVPLMLFIGVLCSILKIIIGRPRPKMFLWENETALHLFNGFGGRYQSFPSGHTLTTFVFLTVLWPHFPRWRAPLLAYALISASARVMSYTTHYVSDVLIGAALGILLTTFMLNKLESSSHGR